VQEKGLRETVEEMEGVGDKEAERTLEAPADCGGGLAQERR
jgi:hypothetical protein